MSDAKLARLAPAADLAPRRGWLPVIVGTTLIAAGAGLGAFLLMDRAPALSRPVGAKPAPAPLDPLSALDPVPAVAPEALRPLTPQEAQVWNAAVPIIAGPNPAARAFDPAGAGLFDAARAVDCLTAAIYYEAAYEGAAGQRAVAQVVLNRVRHPAFPHSVCGVVFQGAERASGCQFTFTCDGAMNRAPTAAGWAAARKLAQAALQGQVYAPVGQATHYHTQWVVPYWAANLDKVGVVGAHIFYRWQGPWGRPAAFNIAYAPPEADVVSLYHLGAAPFAPPKAELVPISNIAAVAPSAQADPMADPVADPVAQIQAPPAAPGVAPLTDLAAMSVEPVATPAPVGASAPPQVVNPVAAQARRPRLPVPAGW